MVPFAKPSGTTYKDLIFRDFSKIFLETFVSKGSAAPHTVPGKILIIVKSERCTS
jgi:hypothetical protein